MYIAAVFHHFPPFPGAGAIRAQSICDALARELGEREDLIVLTTLVEGASSPTPGYSIVSLGDDPGDNRDRLWQRVVGEVALGLKASWRILDARPRAAVVSSPGYLFAATVCLTLRLCRIPYVLDVRDLYPEVYTEAGLMRRSSLVYRCFEALTRSMYGRAKLLIAATAGLARQIGETSGRSGVEVSYNGFPERLRTIHEKKRERFTVCFHGVMGFYQDIETLVTCARALEAYDVDVVVIGYGRKESLLTDLPPANLHFLGRLSFDDTIKVVSSCHAGLCLRTDEPISRDALPVKLFEYLGLGLPVILTPPSEGGDLIQSLGAGVVHASGDVDGIVASVVELQAVPDRLSNLQVAARRLGDQYTRETQASHFAEAALSALGKCG